MRLTLIAAAAVAFMATSSAALADNPGPIKPGALPKKARLARYARAAMALDSSALRLRMAASTRAPHIAR